MRETGCVWTPAVSLPVLVFVALLQVPGSEIKVDVFVPQCQGASARSTATVQVCSGSINLRGAVKCRAYVHSNKPKVKEAIQVLSRVSVHHKHSSQIHGTRHTGFSLPKWSKLGSKCWTGRLFKKPSLWGQLVFLFQRICVLWVRLGSGKSLHKLSKGLGFEEFSLKKVANYIFIFVEVKFRFTCSVIYFFPLTKSMPHDYFCLVLLTNT